MSSVSRAAMLSWVDAAAVIGLPVNDLRPLSTVDNGRSKERANGLEPSTSSLGSNKLDSAGGSLQQLTPTPPAACTAACTSEGENANASPPDENLPARGSVPGDGRQGEQANGLEALADMLRNLSPADRAKLAALLTNGEQ